MILASYLLVCAFGCGDLAGDVENVDDAGKLTKEQCDDRGVDGCEVDSRCLLQSAGKVNIEEVCNDWMPVVCIPTGTICDLSVQLHENAAREIFVFNFYCYPLGFSEELNLDFGDELYEMLFEGPTIVYEWPQCPGTQD